MPERRERGNLKIMRLWRGVERQDMRETTRFIAALKEMECRVA